MKTGELLKFALALLIIIIAIPFLWALLVGSVAIALLPLYSTNQEWAFQSCEFYGSCPSLLGGVVVATFWIIVVALAYYMITFSKTKFKKRKKK